METQLIFGQYLYEMLVRDEIILFKDNYHFNLNYL